MKFPASGILQTMRCLAAICFAGSCVPALAQLDAGCSRPEATPNSNPSNSFRRNRNSGSATQSPLNCSNAGGSSMMPASQLYPPRSWTDYPRICPDLSRTLRLFIVDLPAVNALAMPGGRIYVTRQAVAFLRDENELAALLAHELAHVVFRHPARSLARLFDQLLDIKSLGDRQATVRPPLPPAEFPVGRSSLPRRANPAGLHQNRSRRRRTRPLPPRLLRLPHRELR